MNEIKCPHCGEVFQVDEAGYAAILQQVRSEEFDKEIKSREAVLHQQFEAEQKRALAEAEAKRQQEASDAELNLQKELARAEAASRDKLAEAENISRDKLAEKDKEIFLLRSKVNAAEDAKKNALDKAESEMKNALDKAENEKKLAIADKENEISSLNAKLSNADNEKKLAVTEAVRAISEEKLKLEGELQHEKDDRARHDQEVEVQHKQELDMKDEVIQQYKDFKTRQSTKMIGESLEQHCLTEYNKVRMMAFPNAYFEKDNDARTGSKGDFIFRESTSDGIEFISIMFEMKNEMETTATKHKNEDFLKELDKDRQEKHCEYAVLVSMLEADNEYYNTGIVDVSYQYPKMYVIRPQFLIPLISLLRNAALNSVEVRKELESIKTQNIDVTNFEAALIDFKDKFSKNYETAHKQFTDAIDEIDKSITHLQKVKEALTKSDNQLRLANNKADDLSIKKLTKNNDTMRNMFIEAGANVNS